MLLAGMLLVLVVGFYISDMVGMVNGEDNFSSHRIIVPVKVHMIKDNYGIYTTTRSDRSITEVFNEVNRIWKQADISFEVAKTVMTEINVNTIPKAIFRGDHSELCNHDNFDSNNVNAFFSGSLNGINGFSLSEINSILVADITTVNDFRTTAHECGHILGLTHVEPIDRLMTLGRNGEILTASEVSSARKNAVRFPKKVLTGCKLK